MIGRTLGRYRILDELGSGGMGVVYRARDDRLHRDVALKVLPPDTFADHDARKRFRQEALALSALSHPNVATVYDFDSESDTDFLVMEYIPGTTLSRRLASGALPEREVAALGAQIASALEDAHDKGVIHRDLKPGNIMLTPKGQVKVLDFGLAKLRRPEIEDGSTRSSAETRGVVALLFLPKTVSPPYQVVFMWPGGSGVQLTSSDTPQTARLFDFIVKSGRAVMFPVLKSTYERRDGLDATGMIPNETAAYRDRVVGWVKEVRRSIDYLETRRDIDVGKLGYFGFSWGGRMAGIVLAAEPRFKVAALYVAGFRFPRSMPEADPFNFVSRVKIPVLMLNGKKDPYFPVETAQKPMFMFLGTPSDKKEWKVYDGGHFVPRDQLIKETLAWFDRYLGAVK